MASRIPALPRDSHVQSHAAIPKNNLCDSHARLLARAIAGGWTRPSSACRQRPLSGMRTANHSIRSGSNFARQKCFRHSIKEVPYPLTIFRFAEAWCCQHRSYRMAYTTFQQGQFAETLTSYLSTATHFFPSLTYTRLQEIRSD
jgi:hypothetical protein